MSNSKTPIVDVILLDDRLIVRRKEGESKSAGGIIIPDTAKEQPMLGTVVATGYGWGDEPMAIFPGDEIMFGKYAGSEIKLEGEDYMVMRESDIIMVTKSGTKETLAERRKALSDLFNK